MWMEERSWAKCSCGLLHVCYPLTRTTDQYFGKSQVATIVSMRRSNLKAIMEMQNSSHADLSHSGCHLEFSVNKTIHLFSSKTATKATKGSSNSSGTYQWLCHALHFLEREVNISTLIILKPFDPNQRGMKCNHHHGLINTADVFLPRKMQRPADSGRALQWLSGLWWGVVYHTFLTSTTSGWCREDSPPGAPQDHWLLPCALCFESLQLALNSPENSGLPYIP